MSLSQQMYWVCSDVLSLILQLRSSRDLPAPDILQRRVLGLFDTMMQNAGLSSESPSPRNRVDSMSLPARRVVVSAGVESRIETEGSSSSQSSTDSA